MTKKRQTRLPVPVLGRILIYVRDIDTVAEFYARHFGFRICKEKRDRVVELESSVDARVKS